MSSSRKRFFIIGAFVILVVIAGVGYWTYPKLTYVEQDLTPLAPYAEWNRYDVQISRILSEPATDSFTFVVDGDTHGDFRTATEVMTRSAAENPVFIFNAGDLVQHGTVAEYQVHHLPIVEGIRPVPVMPVPGNHDRGPNKDFAAFRAIYGDEQFSFDYGTCRFVGINNSDSDGFSGRDLDYLRRELSKPGVQHRFVFIHIPPRFVTKGLRSDYARGLRKNAGRFHKLMQEMSVNAVFMGHIHGFLAREFDGVRYIITGGGGASLEPKLGEGGVHSYVVAHIEPDGLRFEVVKEIDETNWVREEIP